MITALVQFELPRPVTREQAREKYGADPSLTYFDTPVVVDNISQQIVADA